MPTGAAMTESLGQSLLLDLYLGLTVHGRNTEPYENSVHVKLKVPVGGARPNVSPNLNAKPASTRASIAKQTLHLAETYFAGGLVATVVLLELKLLM